MDGVVYMYTCRVTGKSYIGQTWDIIERRRSHNRARTENCMLHKAIREYGIKSFDFEVLHEGVKDQSTLDMLEDLEIQIKKSLFPEGYNLRRGGSGGKMTEESRKRNSCMAKKRFSNPEQRKIMSDRLKEFYSNPENKRRHEDAVKSAWNKNHDYRKRVLDAASCRKNDPLWREKQTANLKRRVKPILCVDTGIQYSSAMEAEKATGVKSDNIRANVYGKSRHAGGLHWKYVSDVEAVNVR